MKKIFSILLLSVLIVPFWGTYSLLNHQLKKAGQTVKDEIAEAARNEELVLLTFTEPEIEQQVQWIKPNEFRYMEKMYDIVRSGKYDNKIWYLCYHHEKETRLRNQLSRLVGGMMDQPTQKNDKQVNLLSFFKTLYCQDNSIQLSIYSGICSVNTLFSHHLISPVLSPPVPPPKHTA